jgi:hypothetical protein
MALVCCIFIILTGCSDNGKNNLLEWVHELDAEQTEIFFWYQRDNWNEKELTAEEERALISILNGLTTEDITWNKHLAGITPEYGFHLMAGDDDYYINQAGAPHGQTEISFQGKQWWIESTELFELMKAFLAGSEKSGLSETAPDAASTAEMQYSFDGTVFHYEQNSYDISERQGLINQIMSCTPVGQYIIVKGHTGPKNAVYCIYNTETQEFEKDIIGANLIWHDNDINTAVYSFWSDICAYDGSVIASLELSSADFIKKLAFADENSRVEVTVETDAGYYTKTIELNKPQGAE